MPLRCQSQKDPDDGIVGRITGANINSEPNTDHSFRERWAEYSSINLVIQQLMFVLKNSVPMKQKDFVSLLSAAVNDEMMKCPFSSLISMRLPY